MRIGLQPATSCILWQQDNHTLCFFYHSSPIWQLIAKWKVLHPIGVSSSHQWCLPTAQYVLSNTTSILKFLYANLYQDVKMNTHLKHSNSLIIILKHNHLRFPKTYWYVHNNRMDFNAPILSIQRTKYFSKNNFAVTNVIQNHHITY